MKACAVELLTVRLPQAVPQPWTVPSSKSQTTVLGEPLGEGLGVRDGRGEGDGLGEGEGKGDGLGEGEGKGDGLGEGDGDGLGEGEGEGDGLGEGDGDGDGLGGGGAVLKKSVIAAAFESLLVSADIPQSCSSVLRIE